jgi:hypothetical protein
MYLALERRATEVRATDMLVTMWDYYVVTGIASYTAATYALRHMLTCACS